jgi:hypothetical protein
MDTADSTLIRALIANVTTLAGKIDALVGELNRVAVAVGRLEERVNAADALAAQRACDDPGACLRLASKLNEHEDRLRPLEQRLLEEAGAQRQRERTQRLVTVGISTVTALAGALIGATVPAIMQRILGG